MRSTALYPASTGPDPTEHAMCSSPLTSMSLTVAVERPSVPQVTYIWSSFQLKNNSNLSVKIKLRHEQHKWDNLKLTCRSQSFHTISGWKTSSDTNAIKSPSVTLYNRSKLTKSQQKHLNRTTRKTEINRKKNNTGIAFQTTNSNNNLITILL